VTSRAVRSSGRDYRVRTKFVSNVFRVKSESDISSSSLVRQRLGFERNLHLMCFVKKKFYIEFRERF
jgi:hypothetical protein